MWVLVWIQLITGMPLEYYQLDSFDSKTVCEQYRQRAEILVTHTNMTVVCLSVRIQK
mgnify:CR=1 FL=1